MLEREMDDGPGVRETDLDALRRFTDNVRIGRLFVFIDDRSADFEVQYNVLNSGEYLLPWRSDSITDVLTNGQTYLECVRRNEKVFFSSARELFFGDMKAFVACTPSGQ